MQSDPRLDARGRRIGAYPVTTRSKLMLEVASELVHRERWADKQVVIHLRPQGAPDWTVTLRVQDNRVPSTLAILDWP